MMRCKIFALLMLAHSTCLVAEENFILIHGKTGEVIEEFGPDIDEQVTPACSFNIVLSLMGYDSGILKSEKEPVWEFQQGYDDFLESWKSLQTPESWMSQSCVWYSKMIGLHLGVEKIERYLELLDYGNQDVSGGVVEPGELNPAWISSSLKISPREQVRFIQKMVTGSLPLPSHAFERTRVLLLKGELSEGWRLYGKSGLGSFAGLKIRWFVGWVEKGRLFFPFAYQMRAQEVDVAQTLPRVKELLEHSKTTIVSSAENLCTK